MGALTLDSQAVAPGALVSAADIAAGKLVFTPTLHVNGTGAAVQRQPDRLPWLSA